jgi:tetratricopeptide (TPR) repeat protein
MYLLKLVLPLELSALYPYHDLIKQTIPYYFWLGAITVTFVTYIAVKSFKNNKILFFSIGFFVVNVILLLQLIPVGSAIYADRYVYISSIGFYIILVNYVYKIKQSIFRNLIFGTYIVIICIMTISRIGVWKDSRTLWEDVVKKQPKAVVAWNNLGSEYNRIGEEYKKNNDIDSYLAYNLKAIECLTKAIDQKPDYTSAFYNRGFSNKDLGIFKNDTLLIKKAIEDFSKSIASDLTFVESYQERGTAFDWLGNYEKAISDYNLALQYEPKNTTVIINRGTSKGKSGDLKGAIDDFNLALSINPNLSEAFSNRGLAYAFLKEYDLALADYNKALELEESANTYFNRGLVYFNQKKYNEAKTDFEKSITLNNNMKEANYYIELCVKQINL